MTEHPQTPIGGELTADAEIAPLVILAREHGCETTGSCQGHGPTHKDGLSPLPAYITFKTASEALEWLKQTAHLLDYVVGDKVALSVQRPLYDPAEPAAKVFWDPAFTPNLISAWLTAKQLRVR
jgi:hypothetical protein